MTQPDGRLVGRSNGFGRPYPAALEAAFGRPAGVETSVGPNQPPPPPPAMSPMPPAPPVLRQTFGRPAGVNQAFDPPPGALRDRRPAPESPWWKPDAPTDPWRDAGSPAHLGGPPGYDEPPEPGTEPVALAPRARRWQLRQLSLSAAIVLLLAGLVVGLGGGAVGYFLATRADEALFSPHTTLAKVSPPVTRPPGSISDIAKRVLPVVVSVEVRSSAGSGTGSGVVIDSKGYILTNNHVVSSAAGSNGTLRVLFTDQSAASARIVGRDPKSDLAVLKVDRHGLTAASLGDSSTLAVGDPVIAIGSPLGLASTVTSGIVSALNRPVRLDGEGSDTNAVINAIQTDAAINPGNSGGALVDGSGAVIGINSAIATFNSTGQESGSIGVGFAIPVNEARDIAQQLIRTGKVVHATLGVSTKSVTDGSRDGALVNAVNPGGAAAQAGIQEGDVITKVGSVLVTSSDQLVVLVRAHRAGDVVTITYVRDGRTRTSRATLQSD